MSPGELLALSVLCLFVLGLIAPVLAQKLPGAVGYVLAVPPAVIALYCIGLTPLVNSKGALLQSINWAPSLNTSLSVRIDGLSLLFALLISSVGALVLIYSQRYLESHPHKGRFYALILAFMASMLGIVLSDNMLGLYVFWELTTLSSYFLIGLDHDRASARNAALKALLVTAGSGLALLAGLILVSQVTGSFELSVARQARESVQSSGYYSAIVVLVLIGAFAKSAQFPFHFWLPAAMEAPTPISAYLHSATMVKAGIYLIARLNPILGGTHTWADPLIGVGAATMLVGGIQALAQTDLKLILAYMTVSALGLMTFLSGIQTEAAISAAITYLLAHSLYKGALFLSAGAIDHAAGTRDITKLSGLRKHLPAVFIAAGLAGLSMAGIPPLFGFIGKEFVYNALPHAGWQTFVTLITMSCIVAAAALVALAPFLKSDPRNHTRVSTATHGTTIHHHTPAALWGPALVLGALGLFFGIFPGSISLPLGLAVSSTLGSTPALQLGLWHGINRALLLSIASLLLGAVIFIARGAVRRWLSKALSALAPASPTAVYEKTFSGLFTLAKTQTAIVQHGNLRLYLATILISTTAAGIYAFLSGWQLTVPTNWSDIRFYEWILASLIVLGALAALVTRIPLVAIVGLGASGYGISLVYVAFGAPDLALTQFLVETLTVILLALILVRLPGFKGQYGTVGSQLTNAVISLGVGALFTMLTWASLVGPLDRYISDFFTAKSLPLAHGKNIVNVVLVDFRALDTLGEITVISLAGVGVYGLLRLKSNSGGSR